MHLCLGQLLLSVFFLYRIKYLPDIVILSFQPEIEIPNEELILTLIEKPSFGSLLQRVIVNILNVLQSLRGAGLSRCQMAVSYGEESIIDL